MRLISVGWALTSALTAGLIAWRLAGPADGLEAGLRSAGCGFFYGLLAFHLQRVDPDDGHLQAGLVGAICGLRSLAAPLELDPALVQGVLARPISAATLAPGLLSAMMATISGWLLLWAPLIGSALLLHGVQRWRLSRGLMPGATPPGQPAE
jgi:hypothetical protein